MGCRKCGATGIDVDNCPRRDCPYKYDKHDYGYDDEEYYRKKAGCFPLILIMIAGLISLIV